MLAGRCLERLNNEERREKGGKLLAIQVDVTVGAYQLT